MVTSQPVAGSWTVRLVDRTDRDLLSQEANRMPGSSPLRSQASTWWERFSRSTGQPDSRATSRSTRSGGAPSTDRSVKTVCSRSEARSSSNCSLSTRRCTASVISTNRVSRCRQTTGTPAWRAASTSASGSRRRYLRPSSTAIPLTPASARSVT